MQLAIIVPVLNDAAALARLLPTLAPLRARGARVVVVDGGSADDGAAVSQSHADAFLQSPAGRAVQQHAGTFVQPADAYWFLHADSTIPADADALIAQALATRAWGRFDVRLAGRSRWLPVVAWCMNQRSALTGICTGDQGIFVTADAYARAGGFPQIALMEDIALSKRLKRISHPVRIKTPIFSSGRRWDARGALRTIVSMWWLRLRYFCGADPTKLHRAYYGAPSNPHPKQR
ncbi:MAG: TIGR04283 family arsenosugar biosynthesis glycosyltransferase [Burkholderiaceae bacterium]